MSGAPDKDVWKSLLYSEAWKQYCHEDNLGQSRNNLFMGVQAALIALLALALKPLLETEPTYLWNCNIHLGMMVFGCLAAIIGKISYALDSHWLAVIEAGRAYLNIRWCTVIGLETELGLQQYGPASLEDKWRVFSRENPDEEYQPFADSNTLRSIKVPPLPETRGWSSMKRVVTVLQRVHMAMVIVGVLLIVLSIVVNPSGGI